MAGNAAGRVGDRVYTMTVKTAPRSTTNTIQVRTMTERAHGVETIDVRVLVRTIVIPGKRLTETIRRMCGEVVMAAFTTVRAGRNNADIKAGIAAGSRLGVTRLTIEQAVGECCSQAFGIGTVIPPLEVGAIQRVGD